MAVNLSKGGKISLAKAAADSGVAVGPQGITKVRAALGWDMNSYDSGSEFDLDVSVFMLGASGKVEKDEHFIFYGNKSTNGITHNGDNRTGAGDGDDETIDIDLTALDPSIVKLAFVVTIHEADKRNQNFGMMNNSFARLIDCASNTELIRYDLGEDYSVETAINVCELYNHNGEWKFAAVGSGFAGGLAAMCNLYGLDVG